LSMIFNFIVLLMHRSDYGMCELGGDPRRLLVGCDMSAGKNGNKGEKAEKKKAKDFNAVLLVRAKDTDQARPVVEAILGTEVPRFRLAEVEATSKGKGVLKYLIRLNKRIQPSLLEDALLAGCFGGHFVPPPVPAIAVDSITSSLFLIGDAGAPSGDDPVLAELTRQA